MSNDILYYLTMVLIFLIVQVIIDIIKIRFITKYYIFEVKSVSSESIQIVAARYSYNNETHKLIFYDKLGRKVYESYIPIEYITRKDTT